MAMIWIRRVLAAPLFLASLICLIGAGKSFAGRLPDSSTGMGVMSLLFAAATGAAAYFLLRPDIHKLGGLSSPQVRKWIFTNPLGQAALLYAAAVPIMAVAREAALLPGLLAQCAYTVLSTRAAGTARRFWPMALLALLGFVVLMVALAGTAEVLHPRGFGEGGMLFLLPMYGFPILLAVFGIARALRKAKIPSPPLGGEGNREGD